MLIKPEENFTSILVKSKGKTPILESVLGLSSHYTKMCSFLKKITLNFCSTVGKQRWSFISRHGKINN